MAYAWRPQEILWVELIKAPPIPEDVSFFMLDKLDEVPFKEYVSMVPPVTTNSDAWRPDVGPHEFMQNSIFVTQTLFDLGTSAAEMSFETTIWHTFNRELYYTYGERNTKGITLLPRDGSDLGDPFPPSTFRDYLVHASLNTDAVVDAWFDFNFDTGRYVGLHVVGLRAVIFPFIPEGNYSVTWEWATSINKTVKKEERFSTRAYPREEIEFSYNLDESEYARLKTISQGWRLNPFALPLWMEVELVPSIPADSSILYLRTAGKRIEIGGMISIWESNTKNHIAIVTDIQPTTVSFDPPVSESYGVPYVCGAVLADTYDGTATQRSRMGTATTSITFYVPEVEYDFANPFPTYRGKPVINIPPLHNGNFVENNYQEYNIIDFTTGIRDGLPMYDDMQFDRTFTYQMDDLEDTQLLQQFLGWCRGRYQAFWTPTWNHDLTVVRPVNSGDTEIVVNWIEVSRYRTAGDVMIKLKNGNTHYLQVVDAYQDVTGYDVLVLAQPITFSFQPNDLDMMCELLICRMGSDRFEMSYQRRTKGFLSFPVTQVPAGEKE